MTKAVFLDAGGVFFLPEDEVISPALAGVGVEAGPEVTERAHYAGMRGWDEAGDEGWSAYTRGYAEALEAEDVELVGAVLATAFVDVQWSRVIADSVRALGELSARGVRLAIVSNSDGAVEGYFTSRGIAQVGRGPGVEVATIVDSHVVGVAKPDPGIFDFALEATGVDPPGAVHVGDSVRADVAGARAAGIEALHLDPFSLCPSDDHPHLRSLLDLLRLL